MKKKSRQAQIKENYQPQAYRTRILKEKISKDVPKSINKEEGGLEKNVSVVIKCTDCSSRGPWFNPQHPHKLQEISVLFCSL